MRFQRCLLALFLFSLDSFVYCQESVTTSEKKLGWVRVGAGGGGAPQFRGMALGVAVSYGTGDGLFSLRYGGVSTLALGSVTPERETQDVADLSAMYGLSYRKSILLLTVSTGIGIVQVIQSGPSGRAYTRTIGIPVDVQIMISPVRVFGLGVCVTGNFNSSQSYGSVMIGMYVGLLR
jgi:hypothetical protein